MDANQNTKSRTFHSPWFIALIALLVRFLALWMVQAWPIHPSSELWKSGLEIVNIASSLSSHHGFSSPFGVESGPTAWIPPVYPAIVAAIFSLAGIRTNLAAIAILSIQALCSAAICLPLHSIAKRSFGDRCALWTTWVWALFPYEVLVPILFVWETAPSALLMTLLGCRSLASRECSPRSSVITGLLWGFAALTNTALLAVMPVFLLVPHLGSPTRIRWRTIAVILLVSAVVVSPWIVRNRLALGKLVPVRSNFGEELWVGNHPGGTGRIQSNIGPSENLEERERYRTMGEIAYLSARQAEATNYIAQDPARFLRQITYRFFYFWFAVGESAPVFFLYRLVTVLALAGIVISLFKRTPEILTILGAVLLYPCVYYVTDVYPRYRYPIEPFLVMFGVFAVLQFLQFTKAKFA